jgi:hypothetical protein
MFFGRGQQLLGTRRQLTLFLAKFGLSQFIHGPLQAIDVLQQIRSFFLTLPQLSFEPFYLFVLSKIELPELLQLCVLILANE